MTRIDSNKPLDVLTVKRHKEGVLSDASPHKGLRFVANKNGTKSWIYRYRVSEKKLRQMKLGDYPVMGLAEARQEFNKQKSIKTKHGDPRDFRDTQVAKLKEQELSDRISGYLVSQMVEDYLNEYIPLHRVEKGRIECRRMLEKDVTPVIGHMPVIDVKRRHIHELVQNIAGRAKRIAGMVKVELNGAFEHAITAGRVDQDFVNPTIRVKIPPYVARNRVLSKSELAKFIAWLPSSKITPKIKNVLMLMLLTGCRGGEVVAMEWKNIDFESLEIFLPTTKNKRSHRVFMSTQVRGLLNSISEDKAWYVFPSPFSKKHILQKDIGLNMSKHGKKSGIDHWTPHDLRRTMGTGIAILGGSREVQDRILNHTDSSVSATYNWHKYDEEAREYWQKWADHVDSLYENSDANDPIGIKMVL